MCPSPSPLNLLDRASLVRILTEPKNALTKQYQRLFELDDVKLEFTAEAIEKIADLAWSGRRGPEACAPSWSR